MTNDDERKLNGKLPGKTTDEAARTWVFGYRTTERRQSVFHLVAVEPKIESMDRLFGDQRPRFQTLMRVLQSLEHRVASANPFISANVVYCCVQSSTLTNKYI